MESVQLFRKQHATYTVTVSSSNLAAVSNSHVHLVSNCLHSDIEARTCAFTINIKTFVSDLHTCIFVTWPSLKTMVRLERLCFLWLLFLFRCMSDARSTRLRLREIVAIHPVIFLAHLLHSASMLHSNHCFSSCGADVVDIAVKFFKIFNKKRKI